MIKQFFKFIEESYLKSNKAPLYHFTTLNGFLNIIENNIIRVGEYDNIFKGGNIKFISLTREGKLDLNHYKIDIDIRLELDKNELSKKYKIIPYDFFIQSGKENKPKSNIKRKEPFEFEEIILEDIKNIDKYIISVNFRNDSIFDKPVGKILKILKHKNIKIYENGKEY